MKRLILCVALLLSACDRKPTAAEIEANQQKLTQANQLVETVSSNLNGRTGSSGQLDPWGNDVHITSEQSWAVREYTIRSAGPDAAYNTMDDVVRVKQESNVAGLLYGIPTWAWVLTVWVICSIWVSRIRYKRRRVRRNRKSYTPTPVGIGDFAIVAFSPLVLLIGGVSALFHTNFDPFDFDLPDFDLPDIDLDIDL